MAETPNVAYLQSASNTADLTTYTFTAQNLGTAEASRYIIISAVARKSGASFTLVSITVGGNSATIVKQVTNNATNSNCAALAILAIPTGSSGDVVVTWSTGVLRCAIGMWRAVGITGLTPYDSDSSIASAPSVNLDVPVGFAIGASLTATGTTTSWTGLTENFDSTVESFVTASGASATYGVAATNQTLTSTFVSPSESAGVFASWAFQSTLSFTHYRNITIDHTKVGGSLSNFPVYVSVALGSNVASSSGFDVFFMDATGTTNLNFEMTSWNNTTKTWAGWVNVPTLSTVTDTVIRACYGDSTITTNQSSSSTWVSNYKAVYHLNDNTGSAPQIKDSTSNAYHGTMYNSPTLGTGKVGNGLTFNGSNQYIVTTYTSAIGANPFTFSIWFKTSVSQSGAMMGKRTSVGYVQFDIFMDATVGGGTAGGKVVVEDYGDGATDRNVITSSTYNDGNWHLVHGVRDASSTRVYIDGTLAGTTTATLGNISNTAPLFIGALNDGSSVISGFYFNGQLDESRVYAGALTTGWITTEYNNQSNPSSFYTVGSEFSSGGSTGQIKVWSGSAWVSEPVKVWSGSAFVAKPLKRYNGTTWVTTPY